MGKTINQHMARYLILCAWLLLPVFAMATDKDMVANNFPVSTDKDFPVRPEPVEGWAGKSWFPPRQTIHASTKLSTNGLVGKVISGSYSWRNLKVLDVSQHTAGAVPLTSYFAVLEDPSQALTLADVQKPDIAGQFKTGQATSEALGFGVTHSAYWLRWHCANASDHPVIRLLEIAYPFLSTVQFYQPMADGGYLSITTGNAKPFSTRPYPNRHFVFPINLPAHAEQVYYLRIHTASALLIPAKLWEPQAFHAHERTDYSVQVWYYGMATAMILFNLLLFFALRDSIYLLYVSFVTCTALTVSVSNGLGKEFLWPDTTVWPDMAIGVCYALAIATFMLFMRRMINTPALVPRIDRVMRLVIAGLLLLPVGYTVSLQATATMSTAVFAAVGLLILSIALYCALVKRQRNAIFFVIAYFLLISGGLMAAMRSLKLQVLPTNVFTMNGLLFGSAMEMLLLAFALADRFNMIRRKAMDDVNQANASLEQRLREREAELTESHQQLREIEHQQTLSRERQRLMQDMHDGLGSSLVSALREVEYGRMDEAEIADVLKGCIDDLKLAIDSMEPVEADLLLLLATLRFRLGPRLESSGITLRWEVTKVPKLDWLDPQNALHILRILQEAFTNVIKHTQATEIRVVTLVENDWVLVMVTDNGQGFHVGKALGNGGKGLANQQRRAEAIGAGVAWLSDKTRTRFTLRLPVNTTAHTAG